jgi:hypothetical protein
MKAALERRLMPNGVLFEGNVCDLAAEFIPIEALAATMRWPVQARRQCGLRSRL